MKTEQEYAKDKESSVWRLEATLFLPFKESEQQFRGT